MILDRFFRFRQNFLSNKLFRQIFHLRVYSSGVSMNQELRIALGITRINLNPAGCLERLPDKKSLPLPGGGQSIKRKFWHKKSDGRKFILISKDLPEEGSGGNPSRALMAREISPPSGTNRKVQGEELPSTFSSSSLDHPTHPDMGKQVRNANSVCRFQAAAPGIPLKTLTIHFSLPSSG